MYAKAAPSGAAFFCMKNIVWRLRFLVSPASQVCFIRRVIEYEFFDDRDELRVSHLPLRLDRTMAYPRMSAPDAVLKSCI